MSIYSVSLTKEKEINLPSILEDLKYNQNLIPRISIIIVSAPFPPVYFQSTNCLHKQMRITMALGLGLQYSSVRERCPTEGQVQHTFEFAALKKLTSH